MFVARTLTALVAAALVSSAAAQPAPKDPAKPASPKQPEAPKPPAAPPKADKPAEDSSVLNYTMKRIDGTDQNLADYKGKVVILVNVASKCGYTPQYEALQRLYDDEKERGLVILGFPANNFGSQEPGTNSEISKFCTDKYHVTFPMFAKIDVKGPDQHPLYKKLAAQPAPIGGDPKWNFTKFVVDRSGHVVARFDAKSKAGLEPDLLKKVDELLGDSAGKGTPKAAPPATKSGS